MIEIKVDNGIAEKQPIQTCTTAGCFAGMPLDDKFVIAMRTGSVLKVTVQDTNKRPITLEVFHVVLGFGRRPPIEKPEELARYYWD